MLTPLLALSLMLQLQSQPAQPPMYRALSRVNTDGHNTDMVQGMSETACSQGGSCCHCCEATRTPLCVLGGHSIKNSDLSKTTPPRECASTTFQSTEAETALILQLP